MGYDVIGDIHGQAAKLRALLGALGYRERQGAWRHPERTALFVGDFIDRGPEQRETVSLVRAMVDCGAARAVMGNHELNAIGFASADPDLPGAYLRPHSEKNVHQHAAFIEQVGFDTPLHRECLAWFKTLPLFLDLGAIRVVHAWWHRPHIENLRAQLRADGSLPEEALLNAQVKGRPEHRAVQELTKGLEADLPRGVSFRDKDGEERRDMRIKWFQSEGRTYRELAFAPEHELPLFPDVPVSEPLPLGTDGDTPIFIGHYWLAGAPSLLAPTVACVDYSAGGEGPLVAYRWDGEKQLEAGKFFCTES